MSGLKLVIAVPNPVYSNKLKLFLEDSGHHVVEEVSDGNECLRMLYNVVPDLLLIDYDLPPNNGYSVARVVDEDRICGGILILNNAQEDIIRNDFDLMNFAYITKPLNKQLLLAEIELVNKYSKNIIRLEKEIEMLRENLETRKQVEKAKGILMEIHGISEAEAFRRLQKQSMDTGTPLKEIAKAVILTYNI